MKNNRLTIMAVSAVTVVASSPASFAEASNITLQNLQSAYSGESNAYAKYLEFAQKADLEGYGKVASL